MRLKLDYFAWAFLSLLLFVTGYVLYLGYNWAYDVTKPTVFLGNIRIEQQVNLNNGFYKFEYNEVNNPFELLNGIVEVKDRKIISIVGYKEYDRLWTNGLSSCLLDINHIVESQNISRIDSTNNSFLGYAGLRYSPSKVYSQLSCKSNNDGIAIMTISWSINKNVNLDNQDISKIDTKLIDNNKWLPDYDSRSYRERDIESIKKYSFLNYTLGENIANMNEKNIIQNGKKFYQVGGYGFEKNTSKQFAEKISVSNKDLDESLVAYEFYNGKEKTKEEKLRIKRLKESNYISPDKLYISLTDSGDINGIYGIDTVFKDYRDKDEEISMLKCVSKMHAYAEYLHSIHPTTGNTKFFRSQSVTRGNMIERKEFKILNDVEESIRNSLNLQAVQDKNRIINKYTFELFDKVNNVTVELKCQDNKLYDGAYMLIKFEHN
jgi:hypothetical protein